MPRRARPLLPKIRYSSTERTHCENCSIDLATQRNPSTKYPLEERPPYKWKGHSLSPFDNSNYLRHPKERDGIFFTNNHLTEYRWLIKYHKAQIKDIEKVHCKELRLLAKRRAIVLARCFAHEKPARTREFETNLDILRFQQLWEKSLVYCRLRIELHHLRANSRRQLLNQPELTGPEKESWNEAFLSEVRKEQWQTLLKIRASFEREGEVFPEHLRAPYGQSFDRYFGKLGGKFGWFRPTDLCLVLTRDTDIELDGAVAPGIAIVPTTQTFSLSLGSEETLPLRDKRTVCNNIKKV
jgi:hypothetical protein